MSSSTTLRLGPQFSVPVEAATGSFGVLGQRGSGKSNVAVVYGEELWRAAVPWVAIDPKGDWWGIRSSADGKGPGLPIPVFGGLHADLPVEATAGAYIADLLVDQMLTAVLDVSGLSAGDLSRFLVDFCHRLFRRHQSDPHVRVVIFEEAHRYIPQSVTSATAALKEATAKIPLEGRSFGLGSLSASQRSSRLHKDVLTQFGTLIAMRSPAKLDRDAIGGWVEENAISKELLASLPSLGNGEGWVWSPHDLGVSKRVHFRRRETFDSGATPKVGQSKVTPRTLADIDLAAVKEAMADTIERAKADDPKELRRRLADLERRLKAAESASPATEVRTETVEVPTVPKEWVAGMGELTAQMERFRRSSAEGLDALDAILDRLPLGTSVIRPAAEIRAPAPPPRAAVVPALQREARRPAPAPRSAERAVDVDGIGTGERKVLTVMGQFYGQELSHARLAFLAGYSAKASTLGVILSKLRKMGLVEPRNRQLTAEGLALADPEPLPDGEDLWRHWMSHARVGDGERRVLEVLREQWPSALSHEALCELTGYSSTASTIGVILSKLRKLGLVESGQRRLAAEFAESVGL